mmetsp:Transcript_38060/g.122200  ORF Transcript_38060/g.122200 Transcript_38060/m.122200 type:complete len:251 (-) Transcript_38060:773-1525(-)
MVVEVPSRRDELGPPFGEGQRAEVAPVVPEQVEEDHADADVFVVVVVAFLPLPGGQGLEGRLGRAVVRGSGDDFRVDDEVDVAHERSLDRFTGVGVLLGHVVELAGEHHRLRFFLQSGGLEEAGGFPLAGRRTCAPPGATTSWSSSSRPWPLSSCVVVPRRRPWPFGGPCRRRRPGWRAWAGAESLVPERRFRRSLRTEGRSRRRAASRRPPARRRGPWRLSALRGSRRPRAGRTPRGRSRRAPCRPRRS